jgi:hypothetical protein
VLVLTYLAANEEVLSVTPVSVFFLMAATTPVSYP